MYRNLLRKWYKSEILFLIFNQCSSPNVNNCADSFLYFPFLSFFLYFLSFFFFVFVRYAAIVWVYVYNHAWWLCTMYTSRYKMLFCSVLYGVEQFSWQLCVYRTGRSKCYMCTKQLAVIYRILLRCYRISLKRI